MIKARTLKQILEKVPDDAEIYGYAVARHRKRLGEDAGIAIRLQDGSFECIRARDTAEEDEQLPLWLKR